MTDTLTFGYWGIRGRGQVIRYLLEYTETAYDEKRYLTKEDWFEKAKKSLNLVLSNLPYIIDGDFNLTESLAIQQYIIRRAKKAELLGSHDPKIAGRII
jgi:glutathione S-transferase